MLYTGTLRTGAPKFAANGSHGPGAAGSEGGEEFLSCFEHGGGFVQAAEFQGETAKIRAAYPEGGCQGEGPCAEIVYGVARLKLKG